MNFVTVRNGGIALNVAVAGEGPLILCVHGWPELWYCWRRQIEQARSSGFCCATQEIASRSLQP